MKEFLRFEKKKLVLPIVLAVCFGIVLMMDATYSTTVENTSNEIVDASLENFKLAVYNSSLNGSDPEIEHALLMAQARFGENQKKYAELMFGPVGTIWTAEAVLGIFGIPMDVSGGYYLYYSTPFQTPFCFVTRAGSANSVAVLRLVSCAAWFGGNIVNNKTEIGAILQSGDFERIRQFVYSEGKNPFKNEACELKFEDMENSTKMKMARGVGAKMESISGLTVTPPEMPTFKILSASDAVVILIILLIEGYLVSCVALWVHRRNRVLHGRGKMATVTGIIVFGALVLFLFNPMKIENLIYFTSPLFAVPILLTYGLTTIAFYAHDCWCEWKIGKVAQKLKTKRR